jgi:dihydrolipoamide dehydrogenase
MYTEIMLYDLICIGGGPGGYVSAIKGKELGLKVALIEKEKIGGTCLLRGCIPTKTLLSSASTLSQIKRASDFGIEVSEYKVNYAKMKERKDFVIDTLCRGVTSLVEAHGIDIYEGSASFISANEIKVSGKHNTILSAKKIVIATGSIPAKIPGANVDFHKIHDSSSILELTKLPKSLIILGAGYIGCEFASLFSELGVQVTMVEFLPGIVWAQGKTISDALTKPFLQKGIELKCNLKMEKAEKTEDGVTLHLSDQSQISAEMLLVSVGRVPYTNDLNISNAGLSTNNKGFIEVNEYMQTDLPHIYAIGDVTGKSMLAHTASHQGIIAAMHASGKKKAMHYESIPAVIFTKPEIATVGYTLEQAKAKGFDAKSAKFPLQALGKAQAERETDGFAEIVTEKKTERILGAFFVGKDAGNLISEMTLAIDQEVTLEALAETIHPHPTLSEAWAEAALLARETPIHLPPIKPKK